jgi:oligosaccharyltransferase complex subunit beta
MAAWFLALFGLVASVCANSSTGNSVLVVLEPSLNKANYSTFFNGLTENGYDLTFRAPRDTKPAVIEDEVAQFSHVVIFAPDTKSMWVP